MEFLQLRPCIPLIFFVFQRLPPSLKLRPLSSRKAQGRASLCLGDELGGHIVSGHVDGVGTIVSIEDEGDSRRLSIEVPWALSRFIASKGSIALDGISLTVNEVEGNSFGVNIIPHTWERTTLAAAAPGSRLNVEIDMLARYVARLTQAMGGERDGDA